MVWMGIQRLVVNILDLTSLVCIVRRIIPKFLSIAARVAFVEEEIYSL